MPNANKGLKPKTTRSIDIKSSVLKRRLNAKIDNKYQDVYDRQMKKRYDTPAITLPIRGFSICCMMPLL
jgi:hypothetical protein